MNSVVRFGEISPFWQKSVAIFKAFFGIWQNLDPTLTKICCWVN